MAAETSTKSPDYDPVVTIDPRRFRHTLFVPLALARDGGTGGFGKSAADLIKPLVDALARSDSWRELEDLAAHCEPCLDLEERGAWPGKLHPRFGVEGRLDDWTAADEAAAAERYQETIFFHRFVQRFLYGEDRAPAAEGECVASPMRVFRRRDITRVTIELASVTSFETEERKRAEELWKAEISAGRQPKVSAIGHISTREITLEVETINFHLFDAGVAILAITLAAKRGLDGFLAPIVREGEGERRATFADLLDLVECFRRLYIPYWNTFAVGESPHELSLKHIAEGVPATVTWTKDDGSVLKRQVVPSREDVAKAFAHGFDYGVPELLPWWMELLSGALVASAGGQTKDNVSRWRLVADERTTTTTFISVPEAARLSEGAWARLCFCDKGGDDKPDGSGLFTDFNQLHAYDRFTSLGTRYVMCGYNFACAVSESEGGSLAEITETHMRRHYFQIMLISQFQAVALLAFSNWVSEAMKTYAKPKATEEDTTELRRALHAIEREFQAFVHRYWFTNVSNQVQPTELYAKLRKLLQLDVWFEEVLTEMETSRVFLRDQDQERTARSAEQLSLLAGLGLLVALPASVLGMNMSLGHLDWVKEALARLTFLPGAADCAKGSISGAAQVGWSALVVAIFAGLFWLFIVRKFVGDDGVARPLRKTMRWTLAISLLVAVVCFVAFPVCGPEKRGAPRASIAPIEPFIDRITALLEAH